MNRKNNKKPIIIVNSKKVENPLGDPPVVDPPVVGPSVVGPSVVDPPMVDSPIDDPGIDDPDMPNPDGDIFSEFQGLLPDDVTYSIYRIGKTGKQEFITFANAPYSILQIAQNFGGGDYIVMARDHKNGKYIRRKTVSVARDVFDFDDSPDEGDQELKFLKKIAEYKKLFDKDSGFEGAHMEVMAKQMQMMMNMSNNMMLQNMEMMKQFSENLNEGGGGDLTALASLVEKFTSGKIAGVIGGKKDKAVDKAAGSGK